MHSRARRSGLEQSVNRHITPILSRRTPASDKPIGVENPASASPDRPQPSSPPSEPDHKPYAASDECLPDRRTGSRSASIASSRNGSDSSSSSELDNIEKGATPPRSPSPSAKSLDKLKRLSGLGRNRSSSQTSLPYWTPLDDSDPIAESSWEARATKFNFARLRLPSLKGLGITKSPPGREVTSADGHLLPEPGTKIGCAPAAVVEGMSADDALQEAIRLHESGGSDYCNFFL